MKTKIKALLDGEPSLQDRAIEMGRDLTLLNYPPKSSCRKCYGRGWMGKDADTGQLWYCDCVLKQIKKADDKAKEIAKEEALAQEAMDILRDSRIANKETG